MLRTYASAFVILALTGLIGVGQNAQDKAEKKGDKAAQGQKATITKVDAKNATVTVKMKDKNGKEVEKTFMLTGEVRYFDSTGKVAAAEIFQAGDDVLVIEVEGRLREMHHHHGVFHLGKNDFNFIEAAAEIDMAEIQLGKLAQNNAASATIKKFGERTMSEHTKMNKELRDIVRAQGMSLDDRLDKKHQELCDQLSKVNGAEFDRMYAKDMVKGHEQAIMKFEKEAKHGQNTEVKAWAEKWLPTLREHLKLAHAAAKEVNASR